MPDRFMDSTYVLALAVAAARDAGAIARAAFHQPLEITAKGGPDIVTAVDHAAEALLVERLRAAFPADAILAEERGALAGDGPYCWIIDPLDGTHNYAAGLPFWCLALARQNRATGQIEIGVIYDALHDELFAAVRGGGATLNGAPIHVGSVDTLTGALLAADIGYDAPIAQQMMRTLAAVQPQVRRVRLLGSAVLALAYVAAGRIDGFFHRQLQPWDLAAAWLLLEEAGARVTRWDGTPLALAGQEAVAANPVLQPQIVRLLRET